MTVRILHGDCREVMATLPELSVDAVICDPPYELGFMGKGWDKTGVANDPETWHQALRVLKPGGHLLAFSGTRTYHRMACAIEDAGFEIRDQVGWLYGSGFPKSLDVSKAIDKVRDWSKVERLNGEIRRAREAAGLSLKQIGEEMQEATAGQYGAWYHRGGHMFFETGRSLPSRPEWECLRRVLPIAPEFHGAYEEAERDVVGYRGGNRLAVAPGQGEDRSANTLAITEAATEAARQWQGWGTALKPAFEPLVLAQKPHTFEQLAHIVGGLLCRVASFAETDTPSCELLRQLGFSSTASSLSECLAGLSPMASRFTTETAIALTTDLRTLRSCLSQITLDTTTEAQTPSDGDWSTALDAVSLSRSALAKCERLRVTTAGEIAIDWSVGEGSGPEGSRLSPNWRSIVVARRPLIGTVAANILQHGTGGLNIDGCRVTTDEPVLSHHGSGGFTSDGYGLGDGRSYQSAGRWPANVIHDGSDEVIAAFPQTTSSGGGNGGVRSATQGAVYGDPVGGQPRVTIKDTGSAARFFYTSKASRYDRNDGTHGERGNHHPTVKPTDLMRYLCRLVTPPGGTVLDPFMGSGSTLKAAELEGFSAIGIEIDPAYIEIAKRRIASDAPLFAEVAA